MVVLLVLVRVEIIHVDLQRRGQFLEGGGRPGFAARFDVDDLNTVDT